MRGSRFFIFIFILKSPKILKKTRLCTDFLYSGVAFFFFEVFSVILAWVAVCLFIGACVLAVGILWGMFA